MNNITTNRGQKIILFVVFLIGIAAGALIIYALNYEIFSAQPILAELDKKFQEKIKNGSLLLSAGSNKLEASSKITNFSGVIQEVDPVNYLLLVEVKNIYSGGSIIDFVSKQADIYEVKVLAEKSTIVTGANFTALNQTSDGQGGGGGLDISAIPQTNTNIGFRDLKTGQNINVILREPIEWPKATTVKAAFISAIFNL